MLLTGENFRFGNPVDKFKSDLLAGKLSPDSVKMTKVLQKAQYRRYKYDFLLTDYCQIHNCNSRICCRYLSLVCKHRYIYVVIFLVSNFISAFLISELNS